MTYLTRIEGVPDSSDIKPGMAYFEGTGPVGKTCGHCQHRGIWRESRKAKFDENVGALVYNQYRTMGCAMFKKLSGNYGPAVRKGWAACKYFAERE